MNSQQFNNTLLDTDEKNLGYNIIGDAITAINKKTIMNLTSNNIIGSGTLSYLIKVYSNYSKEYSAMKITIRYYDESKINNFFSKMFMPEMIASDTKEKIIENLDKEVQYTYEMSKKKIGPELKFAGYIVYNDAIIQIMIMELFDGDVASLFKGNVSFSSNEKTEIKEIFKDMINLIKKQVYDLNFYCTDIKPHNFVYKIKNSLKVRMIDFDGTFCSHTKKNHYKTVDDFYAAMLIQLYAFSLVVLKYGDEISEEKLIKEYENGLLEEKINDVDAFDLLSPFLEDPIISNLIENDNEKLKEILHMELKYNPLFNQYVRMFILHLNFTSWDSTVVNELILFLKKQHTELLNRPHLKNILRNRGLYLAKGVAAGVTYKLARNRYKKWKSEKESKKRKSKKRKSR